jgi:hypothetical protein
MGPPITYMLDGKQYVALAGGQGGRGGAAPVPNREAVQGAGGAPPAPAGGRGGPQVTPKLLVFTVDGKAPLPGAPVP